MFRIAGVGLLATSLLVAACNVVVTKTPLFSKSDEAGAPPLKPGLWRFRSDQDCKVDESKPLVDWPKCAGGVVFGDGVAGYYDRDSGTPVWATQSLVLAAGTPRVGQLQAKISGNVKIGVNPYVYAGIRATRSDGDGRILEISFWPVQCGPPPSGAGMEVTAKPLAGIEMSSGDPVCTTTSTDALRAAAKASEAWAPKRLTARWLRGSER
ncbi:MAG TPA: hypothetical protein VGF33_02250 [Caulobacteraceae bacterium]|jgi:hypothetical protein